MDWKNFILMTDDGLSELNDFLKTRSYLEGASISSADKACFNTITTTPDAAQYPYAYRWYIHIASLQGIRFLPVVGGGSVGGSVGGSGGQPTTTAAQQPWGSTEGGDDEDDLFAESSSTTEQRPRESRAEMMARVKQDVKESMLQRK